MESVSKLICDVCQKKFCSVSSTNRHLKKMHDRKVEEKMTLHIRCPLCPEEKQETLGNHDILINHLTGVHCISIKQSDLSFRSIPEFEAWRSKENREVDYACARRKRSSNGDQYIYYDCNRSDSCGFKSHCSKRAKKAGGSIKISGICPSRILVKIFQNGLVSVKYVETHVGHQDELRTKRLAKQEQTMIVDQLHAGLTDERILQDMRKIKDVQLERINLITRGDLGYLIRKFNIDKKRDADDMVATGVLNIGNLEEENSEETLYIQEPTSSKIRYQDELCQFLEEKNNEANKSIIDSERRQQILVEEIQCFTKSLDMESLDKFADMYRTFRNNLEREKKNEICKKSKIEKQMYYPNKN